MLHEHLHRLKGFEMIIVLSNNTRPQPFRKELFENAA